MHYSHILIEIFVCDELPLLMISIALLCWLGLPTRMHSVVQSSPATRWGSVQHTGETQTYSPTHHTTN